jgi:hypothetical protein
VGYYCNCGPVSFGMEDGDEYKALWTCDMVLCMSCFNERKNKMSGDRTAKRKAAKGARGWTRDCGLVKTSNSVGWN